MVRSRALTAHVRADLGTAKASDIRRPAPYKEQTLLTRRTSAITDSLALLIGRLPSWPPIVTLFQPSRQTQTLAAAWALWSQARTPRSAQCWAHFHVHRHVRAKTKKGILAPIDRFGSMSARLDEHLCSRHGLLQDIRICHPSAHMVTELCEAASGQATLPPTWCHFADLPRRHHAAPLQNLPLQVPKPKEGRVAAARPLSSSPCACVGLQPFRFDRRFDPAPLCAA